MATIQEILSIGASGLAASRSLLANAGKNIANVNTPGYSRQLVLLSAQAVPGMGVRAGGPVAVRNPYLQGALMHTAGQKGSYDAQLAALGAVELAVNDLDGVGLGPSLQAFHAALTQLGSNPSGAPERLALLQAGEDLATTFRSTGKQLAGASAAALAQAKGSAAQASALAAEIAVLNGKIQGLTAPGQVPETLVDTRNELLAELSALVQIEVVPREDGSVTVLTGGGRPLVDGTKASVLKVTPVSPLPGQPFGISVVKPNGQVQGALHPIGGALGGVVEAHNDTIVPAVAMLDQMAFSFAQSFNAQHQAGFGADGSTGMSFFSEPASVAGAAQQMSLSADVAGQPNRLAAAGSPDELPGGNSNLLLLAAVQSAAGLLPSGDSLEDAWSGLSLGIGGAIKAAEMGSVSEAAALEQLQSLISSTSGVSIDEEMLAMTQANQAFDAAGALIRSADEMAQTLLSLVR